MKSAILLNTDSGNYKKVDVKKLNDTLFDGKADVLTFDSSSDVVTSFGGYESLAVCGGDGTLSTAVNIGATRRIFYVPCGTLNEAAKKGKIDSVGTANDRLFTYVCAVGSFCEIGYTTSCKSKSKFKAVAYLPHVIKNYKVHEISATVKTGDTTLDGPFTLVMLLRSKQCFGLRFNRARDDKTRLVAIKTPKRVGIFGKIAMFFPFFRVFMIGVSKPTVRKNWCVLPAENCTVNLSGLHDFCVDGEKVTFDGKITFGEKPLCHPIIVENLHDFCK